MPKFTMDILTVKVGYNAARQALAGLSDAELLGLVGQEMFPTIEDRAWNPHEPEHDGLADILRQQLNHDLDVLYAGTPDDWCDDHLAIGFAAVNNINRPALAVLYDGNDPGDWDTYRDCNPVVRLRALRVCDSPTVETPCPDCVADGIDRPLRNGITYTDSATTTTDFANIPWTYVNGTRWVHEPNPSRTEAF